jgi:hypothetical protein
MPTRTYSARLRVSRLTLHSVRSNDWTSQGQRERFRVCVCARARLYNIISIKDSLVLLEITDGIDQNNPEHEE